jgi:hypothetical protein
VHLEPPLNSLACRNTCRSGVPKIILPQGQSLTVLAAQRQGDLLGKAHLEPLLSLDARKAFRALHPGPGKWPGPSLHYQSTRLCSFAEQIALPRPSPRSSLTQETGGSMRQGAPGATSCSSAFRNAPRTFPHHQARGAGLPLHYQYRDCAALPNRPPGLALARASRKRPGVGEALRLRSRLFTPRTPETPPDDCPRCLK